jgi:polyhydroxyalkanoate synthase
MINYSEPLRDFIWQRVDHSRRQQGRLLDALGLGPQETPYRLARTEPGVILKAYGQEQATGPVLVIVGAPLKRPYIWDLMPGASVVEHALRRGLQVYLIEWTQPDRQVQDYGLAHYAASLILKCLETVALETGQPQVFLMGHSMGGTLAAIFAALHPERVQGLILAGAPVHFGRDIGVLGPVVALAPRASTVTALLGNVPGSILSLSGFAVAPLTFGWVRWLDWLQSWPDPRARQLYLRVERWTCEEMPLARRLFEEVIEHLYRTDGFMRGALQINGQRVAPEQIRAPLLLLVDPDCRIVPPQAMLPLCDAVQSDDTQTLWYRGERGVSVQHVGMLVGREAHRQLWPEVMAWIHTHS